MKEKRLLIIYGEGGHSTEMSRMLQLISKDIIVKINHTAKTSMFMGPT